MISQLDTANQTEELKNVNTPDRNPWLAPLLNCLLQINIDLPVDASKTSHWSYKMLCPKQHKFILFFSLCSRRGYESQLRLSHSANYPGSRVLKYFDAYQVVKCRQHRRRRRWLARWRRRCRKSRHTDTGPAQGTSWGPGFPALIFEGIFLWQAGIVWRFKVMAKDKCISPLHVVNQVQQHAHGHTPWPVVSIELTIYW